MALNGRHHLERCLPALARTTGPAFETVLVDNGSHDGTVEWVRREFPALRVLELGENVGFGEANRRGLALARGELVAFLNADTEVEPDWLAELSRVVGEDESIAAACSTLVLLERPELVNARGGGMTRLGYGFDRDYHFPAECSPFDPEPLTREVLFPSGAAMLVRRRDLDAVGGFDHAFFMYHEDVDLGWRLWLAGRRVVVRRDSVVRHAHGGTSLALRGQRWKDRHGIRYAIRSLLKNYSLPALAGAIAEIARLWLRHGALVQAFTAVGWNALHLPGTLAQRWRVQRRRRVADQELRRRGLISAAAIPPVPPQPPRAFRRAAGDALIATPRLSPGYHSALGRLGPGWYARERDGDGWWRWTCGQARCVLQVEPRAAGRLVVSARLPNPDATKRTVAVACNGSRVTVELPAAGWHEVSLPILAGEDGSLDVRIGSPRWVQHDARHDGDFRSVGCAVREVRFEPARSRPPASYRTVSVIVPTYNRWGILTETLAALADQSARDFEVIVVDDGSSDGTWERLQEWKRELGARLDVTLLRQENLKPGRARNHALRHAKGDLVLFIGDDIVPGRELVAEHLAKHNEIGDCVAVLGFTDWHRERMRVTPFLELINRDGQQFSYGHFRDGEDAFYTCFYTSNVSLPRRVLGDDPFHPAFTFVDWEDVELGYRLSLRGLRIVYHQKAAAQHLHPMTMTDFYRRQEHVGRTADVLLRLHPELAGDDAMPPPEPPRWFPLAQHPVRALVPLLSWWDALGLRLPLRLYRLVLLNAYFTGRGQGYPEPS